MTRTQKAPPTPTLPAWLDDIARELPPVSTLAEAARVTRISTRTLKRHIAAKRLAQIKTGGSRSSRVLVARASLLGLLQSLAGGAS